MPDYHAHHEIDELLSRLDAISAPDRWDAALERGGRPARGLVTPSPLRRLAIACMAFAVAAAGFGLVVAGFRGRTTSTASGITSSSALVQGGTLRCTATLPTSLVAGRDSGIRFGVTNVTGQPVKASFEDGTMGFVLTAADGTVYDTRYLAQHSFGAHVLPTKIAPHASFHPRADDVRIRWGGPLEVTPECLGRALPPLHANVHADGSPATDVQAINLVVAATGHLLDACRPEESGVRVDGQIDPPVGSFPSMPATCSITVQREGGFSSAQVLILSPTGLSGVSLKPPYADQLVGIGKHAIVEAVTWDFIVTRSEAIPVYSYLRAQWPKGRPGKAIQLGGVEFLWNGSRWIQEGNGSNCEGGSNLPYGEGGGGSGGSVTVPIFWTCP